MKAVITGENDERVGVNLLDNNEIEHVVEMEFDGEIKYHECEEYPDDAFEQAPMQAEYIAQTCAYAQYYVYDERGYDTLPVELNEPGIKRAREAIDSLSPAAFEDYFDELFRQVIGDLPTVEQPVEYPSFIRPGDFTAYFVDIYLDDAGEIEAISDIHIRYYDENRRNQTVWNDDPLEDRNPDARLQVVDDFVPSIDTFQEYLVYHLDCQIRDCYLGRGEEPPEEYRILGRGQQNLTRRYLHDDITIYDRYHDESANISGYDLEFDYGFGDVGKSAMQAAAGGFPEMDTDAIDESILNPTAEGEPGFLDIMQELLDEDGSHDADSQSE